jgi:putative methyltransferase (TIGR04325 family)
MSKTIPITLFAYARSDHLRRTLACLRENRVPLIYAFSDGPRTPDKAPLVAQVRDILRGIDWCEVVLCEREVNWGLGRSILAGVTEVLSRHEMVIVFEDDLICVPGTYQYLAAALHHYKDDPRVMSVTGWTHPRVTPGDVGDQPYFDGRAECLVWGTWRRAWQGMLEQDARSLMLACEAKGIDRNKYGSDLPAMAEVELQRNIWAVRWLYHHILHGGLCLRPPWSMVEHIGFDAQATNAGDGSKLANPPLKPCPPLPSEWPEPVEHPQCPELARRFYDLPTDRPTPASDGLARLKRNIKRAVAAAVGDSTIQDMNRKEFVKLFLPPVTVALFRRLRAGIKGAEAAASPASMRPEWEYIPEGWAYARTHPEVKGWNVQDVLEIYKQKWPRFVAMVQGTGPLGVAHESDLVTNADINSHNTMMAFAYALALAARHKDALSMLDWGGGIGHYYLLAQALLPDVRIEYHCKDVPLLAEYGAKLFPDQRFYADESCLERTYDFVLASTSLHYCEDWQRVLAGLAKATGEYLYITRLPTVVQAPSYVFIQRPYAYGYNTEYLGWCLNKAEFLAEAGKLGLSLVREFVIGEQPPIANAPESCQYRGFLFRASSEET